MGAALLAVLGGSGFTFPDPEPFAKPAPVIFTVTLAARVCDSPSQIMANRVRGNEQESHAPLGADSVYSPGQAVDPAVEASAQPACKPVEGWRFTFGEDKAKPGAFSVVKKPNGSAGPTAASTPILDGLGKPTDQQLPGAVTVTLTEPQAQLAQQHRLWVQGGRVDDPVGGYGFGTLRCALDNSNGNNVEWIGYPAGVRHVFCFAFYIKPRPGIGALVVRQEVTRKLGYPQRFGFTSSASYARGGIVELITSGDPVSTTLVRAAGNYAVAGQLPAGWRLVELSCASTRPGASTWTITDATATVVLGAGDVVTCKYVAEPPATAATGLTLRVVSSGGLGGFGFAVAAPPGPLRQTATTSIEDNATAATGDDLTGLPPGAYPITATTPAGPWSLVAVVCNGTAVAFSGLAATVTLSAGQPQDCVFHSRRRAGTLVTRLVTLGGTATAGFTVSPLAPEGPRRQIVQASDASTAPGSADGWPAAAKTEQMGPPAIATGSVPERLGVGSYTVISTAPATTAAGSWLLRDFSCNPGVYQSSGAGRESAITVDLTEAAPEAVCTAVYEVQPAVTLAVSARIEGKGTRTAPLVLQISCADGATGQVVLPVDAAGPVGLPAPLSFPGPTTCTVAEPATDGVPMTVRAVVDDVPLTLPGTVQIGQNSVTLTVIASFGAPTATTPIEKQALRLLPAAVIGVGLVGIGAVVLLIVMVRRSTA